ncbi:hypothetical protein CBM2599_B51203 [Cupriavidus taiwanensis]|uniref:Uncharacterized protein n=1 Tax=Cupriavidus taiwanensis TaxID=164546 RepID=A0A375DA43_9BURK|nr:hypothetical protein CBM2599_B51203 [Cupriavidus taiwanensis]SOZ00187.1 hypothetical protein CBM2600_B70213 [Cupriavidus taiwanensis]SPD68142.1 protein of unknown function [Cupriavidus taiwanensis]
MVAMVIAFALCIQSIVVERCADCNLGVCKGIPA